MSTDYKVPLTTIKDIFPHPNADRLEIAVVYDWKVVVQKGRYKVGDEALYIPIDSVLPKQVEDILFPLDAKIKLHKSRVKQIRIRNFPSQGMLADLNELLDHSLPEYARLEADFSEALGIKKYEPPIPDYQAPKGQKTGRKRIPNPSFHSYNGCENIKWYPDLFKEGDEVIVQEKLHGSNIRFGYLPYTPNTLWKKFKKWLGVAPEHEFVYGSNMVQISDNGRYKGFYGDDVYGNALKNIRAETKAKDHLNCIFYGELIGPGIQKGYSYGHKDHHVVLFDIKVFHTDDINQWYWLNPEEVERIAKELDFDFVPVLYRGDYNKESVYSISKGPSAYFPEEKVKEGIVIKSRYEYNDNRCASNKKALKLLNEEYLDNKENTDFH